MVGNGKSPVRSFLLHILAASTEPQRGQAIAQSKDVVNEEDEKATLVVGVYVRVM